MGARQWIDKNKNMTTTASVAVVVGAIAFMVYSMRGDRPQTKDWFTTDEGQTWFKDSNRKVPPFDHNGKEAVFAKVYECHGQKFVAYMKRFKPDGKRRMDEARAAEDVGKTLDQTTLAGVEFQLE